MSLEEVSRKSPAPPASPPLMDSWARGGRRTRRRGGGGSASGSGSFGGGAESDDEYMALCLVMLAQGVRGEDGVKGVGVAAVAAPTKAHGYECSVCGKVYASYQALGGHKTSHRKPPTPPAQAAASACGGDEASGGAVVVEAKVHRCSLCDRTFQSGQALGGHKRLHYEGGAAADGLGGKDKEAAKAKAAALLRDFDLNLPAAAVAAGDEAESAPPEAKRARTTAMLLAV